MDIHDLSVMFVWGLVYKKLGETIQCSAITKSKSIKGTTGGGVAPSSLKEIGLF